MNTHHELYTLSAEKLAEIRAEHEAEPQPGGRLAPRLQEKGRSPLADPALYLTVSLAAVMVALLDLAVRLQ